MSDARDVATVEQADLALVEGDTTRAAVLYAALLREAPLDTYLWFRAAQLLGRLGDHESAVRHLDRAAVRLAEQGQLLLALAAVRELRHHDEEASGRRLAAVAGLFGQGSPRLDTRRVSAPPPLPDRLTVKIDPAATESDPRVVREDCLEACELALQARDQAESDPAAKVAFHPLLSDLTADELVALEPAMKLSACPPGSTVIEQGREGTSIYLLARGSLKVSRQLPDGSEIPLATLGPGAFFGEMALLTDSPRTAQVRCEQPALLFEVERGALERLAAANPRVATVLADFSRQRLLRNLMATSPLFRPLDRTRRASLMELFRSDVFEPGDVVVAEGDDSRRLYVVLTGGALVTRREGQETLTLAELGPGQIFGEISLIKEREASATVTAVGKTVLLSLSRESFNRHVSEFPEVLAHIYEKAVEREETNLQLQSSDTLEVGEDLLI